MKRTPFTAFIVASSLPITIWPLAGLAIAAARISANFDFSVAAILIPFIFGAFHAAIVYFKVSPSRKTMAIAGAGLGLGLASLGTFVFDIPRVVYGLEGSSRYIALLGGPLFYGAVWGIVLVWLESKIGMSDNIDRGT